MNTVYNFLHRYCDERKMPPPNQSDLEQCGKMISYHFKNYWSKNLPFLPGTILENCGYVIQEKGDTTIVVNFYPDSFKPEMAQRCDTYFKLKNKRIEDDKIQLEIGKKNTSTPPADASIKSHRKRITSTQKQPVFSTQLSK